MANSIPRRDDPISRRPAVAAAAALALATVASGCSSHPFQRPSASAPVSLVPPPGVAAPAMTLAPPQPPLPSFADADPQQLHATLARGQQERQLLQDEVAALREQLASTSNQLAAARGLPGGPPSVAAVGGPTFSGEGTAGGGVPYAAGMPAPAARGMTLAARLDELALPGIEKRVDGGVVRLEIPSERLFEEGGAALVPGGAALLAQVAGEIDRVYPQHFIGIEGHHDTEPVDTAIWASPHQLTAARATTVFDFFTTRTPLKRGQLFLVAHGGNHPVVSNATAAGRSRNRRVELVVYPERVATTDAGAVAR